LFVVRGTGQIYGEGSFGPGTLADDSGNSELVMGWVHPWVGLGFEKVTHDQLCSG